MDLVGILIFVEILIHGIEFQYFVEAEKLKFKNLFTLNWWKVKILTIGESACLFLPY